jgi:uncharacterized protein
VTDQLLWLIAGAALAGFVQGIAGFAFGMVSMSVWVWTLDPRLAAVMAVWGSVVGQVVGLFSLRRGWQWPTLWPFLAGAVLGLPLGVAVLPQLDAHSFKLFLGSLLVIFCPVLLWQSKLPQIRVPKPWGGMADAVVGGLGGFMGGLGGFSGIAPTLWCSLRGFDKDRLRAVIQNFNLATLSATFISYWATNVVTPSMWPLLPVVAVSLLVPSLLGTRVYIGLSEVAFRRVVLVVLSCSGLLMLATALPRVLA